MNIEATANLIESARHSDAFDREACVKILEDNLSGGVERRKHQTDSPISEAGVLRDTATPSAQSSQREPCPVCDAPLKPGWHIKNIGGIRVPVKDDELPVWSSAAQPKPESWPEIAKEAWKRITDLADTLEDAVGDLEGDTRFISIIEKVYQAGRDDVYFEITGEREKRKGRTTAAESP